MIYVSLNLPIKAMWEGPFWSVVRNVWGGGSQIIRADRSYDWHIFLLVWAKTLTSDWRIWTHFNTETTRCFTSRHLQPHAPRPVPLQINQLISTSPCSCFRTSSDQIKITTCCSFSSLNDLHMDVLMDATWRGSCCYWCDYYCVILLYFSSSNRTAQNHSRTRQ